MDLYANFYGLALFSNTKYIITNHAITARINNKSANNRTFKNVKSNAYHIWFNLDYIKLNHSQHKKTRYIF